MGSKPIMHGTDHHIDHIDHIGYIEYLDHVEYRIFLHEMLC